PGLQGNRAFASGLAIAGIGAGNIAGPLLAAWWIGLFGWRGAYMALTVFALVLGGAAAVAIRQKPGASAQSGPGLPLSTALRTRLLWLIYILLASTCDGCFVTL